jgi:hypothetical protein
VVYRTRITDEPYPGKERRKLAHPRFLRKEPMAEKNPEERGASAWGSGWRNSDHHPKAVILSLGRACPGEIRKGRWFGSVLPLELFPRRPLFAEDRRKGD